MIFIPIFRYEYFAFSYSKIINEQLNLTCDKLLISKNVTVKLFSI
jgi:hypothetical protein